MNLPQNMGGIDRIVRIVLAIALGAGALYFFSTNLVLTIILAVVAIIFLGTSFIGFCPLYLPFKFTTNKK